MKFTLQMITNKQLVIDESEHECAKFTGANAIEISAQVAEKQAKLWLKEHFHKQLDESVISFQARSGMREIPLTDTWQEAFDDYIEETFGMYIQMSANFMSKYIDNSQLDKPDKRNECANGFADDIWNQLTLRVTHNGTEHEVERLSSAKILSAIGIVEKDLAINTPLETPQIQETKPMRTLEECMNDINAKWGKDQMAVAVLQGSFDLTMDDDIDMVKLGVGQLGLPDSDVDVFIMAKNNGVTKHVLGHWLNGAPYSAKEIKESTDGGANVDKEEKLLTISLDDLMGGIISQSISEALVSALPKKTRQPKASATTNGVVPAEALLLMRNAIALKADEFAVNLGISKASWDNYCKGKSLFAVDANQKKLLVDTLTQRRAEIDKSLEMINKVIV
jgi:DNA-binding transcriptional regulator YiaG